LRPSCGAAPAARAAAPDRLASDEPRHERGCRKRASGREEVGGSGPRERGIPEAATTAACAIGRDRQSEREEFGVLRLAQHDGKRRGEHTCGCSLPAKRCRSAPPLAQPSPPGKEAEESGGRANRELNKDSERIDQPS